MQIDHHFFHKIERPRDNYSFYSYFYELSDFDEDGKKELLFSFNAGFGLYPRGIFKIEFPSLKIVSSPTEHMALTLNALTDLNSDGVPEILTTGSAPSNSNNAKQYSDTCSYLLALDFNLQPLFKPIKLRGNYSYVHSIPSFKEDSIFYALSWSRSDAQNPAEIMLVNTKGNVLKSKKWSTIKHPENTGFDLCVINNLPYLVIRNVGRFDLNTNLSGLPDKEEFNKQFNKVTMTPLCFDLNNDGTDELIFNDTHANITILNDKTNEELTFRSPIPLRWGIQVYPYYENNKVTQYAFATLGGFFFLKYQKNAFYFILYIIYVLIFTLTTGLIHAILYYQKRTIEKKWTTEKQLSELQFNAVKNQLNPHFLFNSLNSVAFMINEGRNGEAYDFLLVNSRMIQRVMDDAKEVKRPLKDEIQFTKDYISIQKHRFKERFDADFIVHPGVDQSLEVPKMCIHTYVENAIKHGFRNTRSGGLLEVKVKPFYRGILISVTDNGMGRKAASEYKDSSGNGISIMNEFYRLFEKYHHYRIKFNVTDLTEPTGTRIELKIRINE